MASPRESSRPSSKAGTPASIQRVTAEDSFVPLGPAAAHVVLTEDDVVAVLARPIVARMSLPTESDLRSRAEAAAAACGVDLAAVAGDRVGSSPVNGLPVSSLAWSSPADVSAAVARAAAAYDEWRLVPAPVRGAVVRRFGELLREHLDDLATLVTVEVGKITSEARGEVQEMVDICDYAVGLSRQLFGRTMTSERPGHRLMETWHPLGVVGVISAFNFPVAVWSWNTAIALVCGDTVVWKPSEQAPLCALASGALLSRALTEAGFSPDVSQVVLGDAPVGLALVDDPAVALLSATGSTRMGREVGTARRRPVREVAARARRQQRRHRRARRPTSTSPPAASSSRRRARPASGARRCAG